MLDYKTDAPSELVTLNLQVESGEEGLALRRLELVRITNFVLDEPGTEGGWSWRGTAGWRRKELACFDCPQLHAALGFGLAKRLGVSLHAALFVDAALSKDVRGDDSARAGIVPGLYLLGDVTPTWRVVLQAEGENLNGLGPNLVNLEQRISLSPRWHIRVRLTHQEFLEGAVSLNHHW